MWETKVRRQGSSGKWERSRETTFFHLSFVSCKGDNEAAASEETNGETSGETNGASWETRQQGQRWTKTPVRSQNLYNFQPSAIWEKNRLKHCLYNMFKNCY